MTNNKGGIIMKFYLVYSEVKPECQKEWGTSTHTFTKSDMDWFGVDEKRALQQFRTIVRNCGDYRIPHIKCVELDTLPEYQTESIQDQQINEINKKVVRGLISRQNSRAVANKKGEVTVSFTLDDIDEARDNHCGNTNSSLIHNSKANRHYVADEAYNKVFEIILAKKMKQVDIFIPVKVNINGKLLKKYMPTNKQ